jgi:hypothetical protein
MKISNDIACNFLFNSKKMGCKLVYWKYACEYLVEKKNINLETHLSIPLY